MVFDEVADGLRRCHAEQDDGNRIDWLERRRLDAGEENGIHHATHTDAGHSPQSS
jgi:hypothetical protein